MIPSSGFNDSANHQNPTSMPVEGKKNYGENVMLGKFKLTTSLMSQIAKTNDVTPTHDNVDTANQNFGDHLSEFKYGNFYQNGNFLYANYGEHDQSFPAIGDIRVNFTYAVCGQCSLMSQQQSEGDHYTFHPWEPEPHEDDAISTTCMSCCSLCSCADASCKALEVTSVDWFYTQVLSSGAII